MDIEYIQYINCGGCCTSNIKNSKHDMLFHFKGIVYCWPCLFDLYANKKKEKDDVLCNALCKSLLQCTSCKKIKKTISIEINAFAKEQWCKNCLVDNYNKLLDFLHEHIDCNVFFWCDYCEEREMGKDPTYTLNELMTMTFKLTIHSPPFFKTNKNKTICKNCYKDKIKKLKWNYEKHKLFPPQNRKTIEALIFIYKHQPNFPLSKDIVNRMCQFIAKLGMSDISLKTQ